MELCENLSCRQLLIGLAKKPLGQTRGPEARLAWIEPGYRLEECKAHIDGAWIMV